MATCNAFNTINIGDDCQIRIPGIQTVYNMAESNIDRSSGTDGFTIDVTGHTITEIHLTNSGTDDTYQEMQIPDGGNYTASGEFDNKTLGRTFGQEISVSVPLMDGETRYKIDNLIKRNSCVIVKANNGRYYHFGTRKGGYWSATDMSGVEGTDLSGFEMVYTSFAEAYIVYEIAAAAITAVINEA